MGLRRMKKTTKRNLIEWKEKAQKKSGRDTKAALQMQEARWKHDIS